MIREQIIHHHEVSTTHLDIILSKNTFILSMTSLDLSKKEEKTYFYRNKTEHTVHSYAAAKG